MQLFLEYFEWGLWTWRRLEMVGLRSKKWLEKGALRAARVHVPDTCAFQCNPPSDRLCTYYCKCSYFACFHLKRSSQICHVSQNSAPNLSSLERQKSPLKARNGSYKVRLWIRPSRFNQTPTCVLWTIRVNVRGPTSTKINTGIIDDRCL